MEDESNSTGRADAPQDRRRHCRVRVTAVATLYSGSLKIGEYLIRNLSVGGALLSGQAPVQSGAEVRVLLGFPCSRYQGVLTAEVLRMETDVEGGTLVALVFRQVVPSVHEAIRSFVKAELERPAGSALLIVDARVPVLASVARTLSVIDRRILLARTPLDMMRLLCDRTARVDVVLAGGPADDHRAFQLLAIVAEDFPIIRRFLISEKPDNLRTAPLIKSGDVHAVLQDGFAPEELQRVLEPEPTPLLS